MDVRKGTVLVIIAAACSGQERILWRDPGRIDRIDFSYPAGGRANLPRPPFTFKAEEGGGTNPKVLVRDAAGVEWRMKGGLEVKADSFTTRLVAALGYYAEAVAFVPSGTVAGVGKLTRAANFVKSDGTFAWAAFERRDPNLKYLSDHDWAWNDNPFGGTPQLNGLKVLVMLLSNWDNKDIRNRKIGSNTGILERRVGVKVEWIYFVNDWGQTLGAWGPEMKPKGWNCQAFHDQTSQFVQGRDGDFVRFGFTGQHSDGFKNDIRAGDVRWLLRYLSRVTDRQIRAGLLASGASQEEAACFGRVLRTRITQLKSAVQDAPASAKAPLARRPRGG